jgi:hypothetical protein
MIIRQGKNHNIFPNFASRDIYKLITCLSPILTLARHIRRQVCYMTLHYPRDPMSRASYANVFSRRCCRFCFLILIQLIIYQNNRIYVQYIAKEPKRVAFNTSLSHLPWLTTSHLSSPQIASKAALLTFLNRNKFS